MTSIPTDATSAWTSLPEPTRASSPRLDGTVIFSGYTADAGHVIALQHGSNLVSVYKHCGSLLKSLGDKVAAGEVIALVGRPDGTTGGPHLHFELWHRGQVLNPAQFIVF